MQNTGHDAEDHVLLILGEAQGVQSEDGRIELLLIVDAGDLGAPRLIQVEEVVGASELELVLELLRGALEELIEDVEGALAGALLHDARGLEEIRRDRGAREITSGLKGDLDELTLKRKRLHKRDKMKKKRDRLYKAN